MGNFSSLYIARSGIFANQRALDVTAHNIANANTEGYSRQRAVFKTSFAFQQPAINISVSASMLGTGVTIENIERVRDNYLDRQAASNNSDCQYWKIHTDLLQRAELAFAEPNDYSLDEALNSFFNVWKDLNQNPTDPGARSAVRETARTLADRFELSHQQLTWAVEEANDRLFKKNSGLIDDASKLINDIAYYNDEISQLTSSGGTPNDLMDRRDLLVDELSGIADILTEENPDGTTDVLMRIDNVDANGDAVDDDADQDVVEKNGEYYLYVVRGASAKEISFDKGNYETAVNDGTSDTAEFLTVNNYRLSLKSGSIAGVMDADIKIRGYMDELDKIAYTLVEEVNKIHAAGFTLIKTDPLDPDSVYEGGGNFFTPLADVEVAARMITIDDAIEDNLSNIAASGDENNPDDGENALKMAQLEEETIGSLNDCTISGYYGSVVTGVGVDLNGALEKLDIKMGAQEQIELLRQSISGVNLDEEMTNMIMFQRAYQASSRVIVTADRMLEELINLVR